MTILSHPHKAAIYGGCGVITFLVPKRTAQSIRCIASNCGIMPRFTIFTTLRDLGRSRALKLGQHLLPIN